MSFSLTDTKQILSRTPQVLRALLTGLNEDWLSTRKREDGFTPSDVVGHLIANEEMNFVPRMKALLDPSKPFGGNPAQEFVGIDKSLSLEQRLDRFESLRKQTMELIEKSVSPSDLIKTNTSEYFGEVNLTQFLAYWVEHDLNHLFQVEEILANRYKGEVGPWEPFLRILKV